VTRTTTEFELEIPLAYIESTIPAGQTISDYRRRRPDRPSRWERLKNLAGNAGVAAASVGLSARAEALR
jgi:hypothetical protein